MLLQEGSTAMAVRIDPSRPDHWTAYPLGAHIGQGGTSSVYEVALATNPPLVAKIYNSDITTAIKAQQAYALRLLTLASHRADLISTLGFGVWPRRLIFRIKDPSDAQIAEMLAGISMQRLNDTTPLHDLINFDSCRMRMSAHDTLHIAVTLAEQLDKLHGHPWQFVFGDMSAKNIHVSNDFARVHFIDTDAFQFTLADGTTFRPHGLTPSYRSPGSMHRLQRNSSITPADDDYVLAILIFQLLLAQAGFTQMHPFTAAGSNEEDNMAIGLFPYNAPDRLPPPDGPLEAYEALPPELRTAFSATFTHRKPVTAAQWASLLHVFRRSLPWP